MKMQTAKAREFIEVLNGVNHNCCCYYKIYPNAPTPISKQTNDY